MYIAKLVEQAGFPPGVVNIISGEGSPAGSTLAFHMKVRIVSFTGSSATGQKVQMAAAKSNMKPVLLECGGNSPAIIFDDADIDNAARWTMFNIQINSGQLCVANSRLYIHENVKAKFMNAFQAAMATAKMGDPLDPTTKHGPQIDEEQYHRVKEYLDLAEKESKTVFGGNPTDDFLVKPTMVEGLSGSSQIMKDEIFGPITDAQTFSSEDEVIKSANDTEFGLYAAVFTKDIDRAIRVSKALQAGAVSVNSSGPIHCKDAAIGGYKMSGIGREGYMYSMDEFLQEKGIIINTAGSA